MDLVRWRRRLAASPLARPLGLGYRAVLLLGVWRRAVRDGVAWLVSSREHTNFTYDLTPRNVQHLAWFVSHVTGCSYADASGYVRELEQDADLREALRTAARGAARRGVIDVEPRYGRRVAWYAIVRALKPTCTVEAGVDKGLGTMVLAAAVHRNAAEGQPGRVVALDLNPHAGSLLCAPYDSHVDLVLGDSVASLRALTSPVSLFLHDSDHHYGHERAELDAVQPHLAPGALLLSDAASESDALADFARERSMTFLFLGEEPTRAVHAPQGVGAAWLPAP